MMDETQGAEAGNTGAGQIRTPPYISFKTLVTFVEDQKDHGLPTDIDRSVLTRFSGSTAGQLLAALKFLGLIDANQAVQPELQRLIEGHGTAMWPDALEDMVMRSYAPLFAEDLERATPAKFHDVFKTHYTAKEAVIRKCEVFFLKAAEAAGIKVNPRIIKHRAPRPSTSQAGRAASKAKKAADGDGAKTRTDEENLPPAAKQTPYEMLIDILDPVAMEEEEQQAVWTLIRYLKRTEPDD